MTAKLRKHYVALIAVGAFHFVFFFPLAFMGRVVSPNDVFYQYEPWATYRPASIVRVQNPLMNDPPTAYLPLMSLVKGGEWPAFHWNPYVGGGIPGFGSSTAAILSPFILLPSLTVPMSWIYTAIIFLKLNVAFFFGYFWLREEGLGKRGAAVGAIIIAGAGIYSVRWLWQITNATALYPALLWMIRRAFNGKRTSIVLMALLALAFALSGFPSTMAYGAWLSLLYAIFLAIRCRRFPAMRIGEGAVAAVLALVIAAPSIVPLVHFLRRSGYLEMRTKLAGITFPLWHWRSFIDPERLGNPGNPGVRGWSGDPALGMLNNFVESTIYVGLIALPLVFLALFRRHRTRWFWVAVTLVVLCCMFGVTVVPKLVAHVPGFRYTALARTSLLLPVAVGFLAANGAALLFRWVRRGRRLLAGSVAAVAAADLALFAGLFHPYLPPDKATIPVTPVIEFLRNDPAPFRYIGFLTYLWPNSAELYRLEDVASHFGSEAIYRRLLSRIDPTSWSGTSTVIVFNSLKFNFNDPLVSMLGVRYFLEHRPIDIIKWTTFAGTVAGVKQESGAFVLAPRSLAQRTIRVDAEPFWAIELPVSVESVAGARPRLDVELSKNDATVWSRSFVPADIGVMNKIYVPLRQFARGGESVKVRLWSTGMRIAMLRAQAPPGEAPFFYGRVATPVVFERELPDGRIFRNVGEVPRFNPVKRVSKLNDDEFIAARNIDLYDEAVITDDPVFPPAIVAQDGRVELLRYSPDEQRMTTTASAPMFLASSEKLTPELRITIDGKRAKPIRINTLFAAVTVPAGRHEVVFSRRIGGGWWWASALAAVAILLIGGWELRRVGRKNTERRPSHA